MKRGLVHFLAGVLLASCAPADLNATPKPTSIAVLTQPTSTQVLPAPTPMIIPSTVPPPPTQSATPVAGPAYSDSGLGISFTYPREWEILPRTPDDPPGLTLHAPPVGEGPEPIIFAITIVIDPVSERSVKDIVDQQMAQVPADLAGGIKRKPANLGGETAEEVIGLPSQEGAVETFVLHGGQLFLIILQPYDETNESLRSYLPQMRTAYDSLLSSWKFLK
jgi:hypothetical protein